MKANKLYALYFSPTGKVQEIAREVAGGLAEALGLKAEEIDFTLPAARAKDYSFAEGDLVVVAAPTYAGKLPNKILPDFQQKLHGNGAMAVAVTVYGNRSFDNSLAEMVFTLENDGFHTLSGGAFVARHTFSQTLGANRPDAEDKKEIKEFAAKSAEKLAGLTSVPAPVVVDGDAAAPYYTPLGMDGQPAKFLKATPVTDKEKCINCGNCAKVCPVASVNPADVSTNVGPCIKCQACVRKCPQGAKKFEDPIFLSHVQYIETKFQAPNVNKTFF